MSTTLTAFSNQKTGCENAGNSRYCAIKDSNLKLSRIFLARVAFCSNQSCARTTIRMVFTQPRPEGDLACTPMVSTTSGDVRRFTTEGLSPYRATRDDYVLKRPPVLVGSAWPGASRGSVIQMVVPFPRAETSLILPPSCCVTRLWTM